MKKLSAIAVTLVSATLMVPFHATAQLEEIIVTAQKREENLQDVPIAIAAVSRDGMDKANIATIDDLGNAISGINIQNMNGYVTPVVRGAGTITPGSAFYQAVATYVDDVYVTRSYGSNFSLDSTESIQLLKGPQGALYGRNATAGAIIVNTKQPQPGGEFEGNVKLSAAEYGTQSIGLSLSGGFSDTAAGSIEAYWGETDGFWDVLPASQNASDDKFQGNDELTITGKLVFEPNDSTTIRIKASHTVWEGAWNVWDNVGDAEFLTAAQMMQINPTLAPGFLETIAMNPGLNANAYEAAGLNSAQVLMATILGGQLGFPAANAIGLASAFGFSPEFGTAHTNLINSCELGNFTGRGVSCPPGHFHNREDTSASLHMTFGLNRFDLVSITSFRDGGQVSAAGVADIDPTSFGAATLLGILAPAGITNIGLGFTGEFDSQDFQQEIRLVSNESWDWQWIVGAHYFEESSDQHRIDGNSFGGLARNVNSAWENTSFSAFAQATFPLSDNWSATLGTRHISDDYELTDNLDFSSPLPIVPAVAAIGPLGTVEDDHDFTTYLVRLEYQGDNWLGYFSASSGYKSGSLNADGPAFGRADPEELESIEIGFKSSWNDNTLQFNGAVFMYDYTNPHVTFVDNATGGQVLLNIPESEITGVELDLNGLAGDNVTWFINLTALDSEYEQDTLFNNAAVGLTSVLASGGKQMGAAPPFAAVAGLDWRVPTGGGEWSISPSLRYNGGVWYDPENRIGSGGASSDEAFTVANLNVRYEPNDGNWNASLWVKNLFDEEYYSSGLTANGFFLIGRFGDPQQIGLTVDFNF